MRHGNWPSCAWPPKWSRTSPQHNAASVEPLGVAPVDDFQRLNAPDNSGWSATAVQNEGFHAAIAQMTMMSSAITTMAHTG